MLKFLKKFKILTFHHPTVYMQFMIILFMWLIYLVLSVKKYAGDVPLGVTELFGLIPMGCFPITISR